MIDNGVLTRESFNSNGFGGLAASPDGEFVALAHGQTVTLQSTTTGTAIWSTDVGESVGDAAFSPDGSIVYVALPVSFAVIDVSTGFLLSKVSSDGITPTEIETR